MNNIKEVQIQPVHGKVLRLESSNYHLTEDGTVFHLEVYSPLTVAVKFIRVLFEADPKMSGHMLANGYQTWTETKRMGSKDRIKKLKLLAKVFHLNCYGDYKFYKGSGKVGHIHSHEFTDYQDNDGSLLLGSLNQNRFFTIIERQYDDDTYSLYLDLEGLTLEGDQWFDAGHYFKAEGQSLEGLYDDYFTLIQGPRRSGKRCNGWTSWYNYYTNITDKIIHHNLEALGDHPLEFDVFQIDDGYQVSVGDWLNTNDKFEESLRPIARKAKEKGMRPGLWLAPFICERTSFIYKEKKEWLLKDKKGRPVVAGFNPLWSYNYYALDLYNEGFRKYLKTVFDKVFIEWEFELVKLDFLYAVNLMPREGKSRAMVMADAMRLLNGLCKGDILGCGIPIASALKQVEYCRIGADVAPYWEDNKLKFLGYRERISTKAALYNTLNRYILNQRVFANDPDVFIIREEDNRLTKEERFTLFAVNELLGDLVFFSDDISRYQNELKVIASADYMPLIEDVVVTQDHEVYNISFTGNGVKYLAMVNMSDIDQVVVIDEGNYYHNQLGILKDLKTVDIKPHETIILLQLVGEGVVPFMADYLLGGSVAADIRQIDDDYILRFHQGVNGKNPLTIIDLETFTIKEHKKLEYIDQITIKIGF